MKILSNTISIVKNKPQQYSTWGVQTRRRKGLHSSFSEQSNGLYLIDDQIPNRRLSDEDLWTVYQRCSDVRACVDSIVRRVATFDWMIVPKVSPQNAEYDELSKICKKLSIFLKKPNRNGTTWQEIMTAMLTDCLVFDAGVLELAYDRQGQLQELVPLRGSSITPMQDKHGKIKSYEQNSILDPFRSQSAEDKTIVFRPKQIMYFSLYHNTASVSGNPLIESIVNEVITLMRATEHAMLALDADEVPPGILVLAGISGRAAQEARADLQMLKGQDHKIRVMTTPDPTGMGAKWLELRRTPKDLSMREIVDDIRRCVYRTFGVMPVEMGMTDSMPRATATVQMDVASSHLVTPILELLQAKINSQLLPAFLNSEELGYLIEFKFDREARLTTQEQNDLASTYRTYITQGVMTRNEVRELLGFQPLIGGDVPTIEVAGQPVPLESVVASFDKKEEKEQNSAVIQQLIDEQLWEEKEDY